MAPPPWGECNQPLGRHWEAEGWDEHAAHLPPLPPEPLAVAGRPEADGGTLQRREGTRFRASPRRWACTPGHLISKPHAFPTHLDAQVLGCLVAGISDLEM